MKRYIETFNRWLCSLGIDFTSTMRSTAYLIRDLPKLLSDYRALKAQNREKTFSNIIEFNYPVVMDRYLSAGTAKGGYFYQDLIVAQKIFEKRPKKHVDIASRIDGFVAHVASFRKIEVFDIRPVSSKARNITFKQGDLMKLDPHMKNYSDSVSCLHALEHFGLGRYGDPVDLYGHEKGLNSLIDMLKPGGILYLSVPIGVQRIEFNAHKVFSPETILGFVQPRLKLLHVTCIDPQGDLLDMSSLDDCHKEISKWSSQVYGLGIFEFEKLG